MHAAQDGPVAANRRRRAIDQPELRLDLTCCRLQSVWRVRLSGRGLRKSLFLGVGQATRASQSRREFGQMRVHPFGLACCRLLLFALGCLLLASPARAQLTPLESAVVAEVNLLRTQPQRYAELLRLERAYYNGPLLVRPGALALRMKEGVAALDEAVEYLEAQAPVGPLDLSPGLSCAARDHVFDQGRSGMVGHAGSDASQPADRVARYGMPRGVGENLAYGCATAHEIVMQLVIDDGVPDRGHRKNFFVPDFHCIGVACGEHSRWRCMCAIDFAGGFSENTAAQSARPGSPRPTAAAPSAATVLPTGNTFKDARALADAHYAAALAQDRESWRASLTAANRVSTVRLWRDAQSNPGSLYGFGCTEKMVTGRIQLRYLRRRGSAVTACFITLVLENGRWLVDEVSY